MIHCANRACKHSRKTCALNQNMITKYTNFKYLAMNSNLCLYATLKGRKKAFFCMFTISSVGRNVVSSITVFNQTRYDKSQNIQNIYL